MIPWPFLFQMPGTAIFQRRYTELFFEHRGEFTLVQIADLLCDFSHR